MRGEGLSYNFGSPQELEGRKQELLAKGSGERAKSVDEYRKKRIEELRQLNPTPDSKEGKELIRLQLERTN